jgi:hypothetical protein
MLQRHLCDPKAAPRIEMLAGAAGESLTARQTNRSHLGTAQRGDRPHFRAPQKA